MIIGLKGILREVFEESIGVDVNGVVYEVYMAQTHIREIGDVGSYVELYTYLRLSNDIFGIYGFVDPQQLNMFHKLITVNSVGPRNAQAILGFLSIIQVTEAILTENTSLLTGVPGIGARTASRIVLELKDKINIPESGISPITTSNDDEEIISALAVLGYSRTEVTTILGSLVFEKEAVSLEDKIKLVLGQMA